MSVINRMLADLEQRGGRPPDSSGQQLRSSSPRPRPRRRRLPARLWTGLLALVLAAVAALLWHARGEQILLALMPPPAPPPGAVKPPAPPVIRLLGVSFEQGAGQARLNLRLSGELERPPRYSRSGDRATLLVDARARDLVLPAPPGGQQVFRGISLAPAGGQSTRIGLELAPEAALDLEVDGARVVLAGRLPQPAEAEPEPAETEPEPAETEPRPTADPGPVAADASQTAEPATDVASGSTTGAGAATADGVAPADAPAERAPAVSGDGKSGDGSTDAQTTAAGPASTAETGNEGAPAAGVVRKQQSMSPEMRAQRRYREAREALDRGELVAARRALRQALALDPALHAARDLQVSLLRRAGETDAARQVLAEGVALAPGRLAFAMPYARLLVDTGALDRAARILQDARVEGTGRPGFHSLLAAIEQRRGRHRSAVTEYTRALEIRSDNGLWWLGLGVSLAATDRPEEARAAFREAVASGSLDERLERWARGRISELPAGSGS